MRLARANDARVILDAAPPRSHVNDLIAVDVFRANAGETTAITGIDVDDVNRRARRHDC